MKSFTNWRIQLDCLDFGLSIRRMPYYNLPPFFIFQKEISNGFSKYFWTSQLIDRCSREEGKGKDG
jgi:hypothetical protein